MKPLGVYEMDSTDDKPKRGRPRHVPPLKKRQINLTDVQVGLLRKWGRGDVSAGLRWLIDQIVATGAVREPDLPHNSG